MLDLPGIKNGCNRADMMYDSEPVSAFQKLMRKNFVSKIVLDHICKEMTPLVEARITQIPLTPGSDWRDLPNKIMRLSDGSFTNILKYSYR